MYCGNYIQTGFSGHIGNYRAVGASGPLGQGPVDVYAAAEQNYVAEVERQRALPAAKGRYPAWPAWLGGADSAEAVLTPERFVDALLLLERAVALKLNLPRPLAPSFQDALLAAVAAEPLTNDWWEWLNNIVVWVVANGAAFVPPKGADGGSGKGADEGGGKGDDKGISTGLLVGGAAAAGLLLLALAR